MLLFACLLFFVGTAYSYDTKPTIVLDLNQDGQPELVGVTIVIEEWIARILGREVPERFEPRMGVIYNLDEDATTFRISLSIALGKVEAPAPVVETE